MLSSHKYLGTLVAPQDLKKLILQNKKCYFSIQHCNIITWIFSGILAGGGILYPASICSKTCWFENAAYGSRPKENISHRTTPKLQESDLEELFPWWQTSFTCHSKYFNEILEHSTWLQFVFLLSDSTHCSHIFLGPSLPLWKYRFQKQRYFCMPNLCV